MRNLSYTLGLMKHTHDNTAGPIVTPQQKDHTVRPAHVSGEQKFIPSVLSMLVLALVFAFALLAFVFQSYQVDGPSMLPTLNNSDRLIVLKVPKTWSRITRHPYIPKRGDVVVFVENDLPELGSNQPRQLIKRVIGLPGDHIVISNNVITIYNKEHPNGFNPDVTLPYGKDIAITTGNVDRTIPPNQVFVCGDNRINSFDSRSFGPVSASKIVGKLVLRIWPIGHAEKF